MIGCIILWIASLRFCQGFTRCGYVSRMANSFLGANNQKFEIEGGNICYDLTKAKTKTPGLPFVVYLPGLVREKNEAKSINLHAVCKRNDVSFLAADYFGVGTSSGKFSDGYISRWTVDTIRLIEHLLSTERDSLASRQAILVGHGVGAWIAFLMALKRPELVSGILGISADADFTEELLWKTLPEATKEKIMREGMCEIQWGKGTYPITRMLIEDGRKNLLLSGAAGSLAIHCPVRLLHALHDEEVPLQMSQSLLDKCATRDATLLVLQGAAHAMEGERELQAMRRTLMELLDAHRGQASTGPD